jgi:3-oxoacyl-[acyl-carrier-protein] synthase-1
MLAANPVAPAPVHCWDGEADENMPVLNFVRPGNRPEKPGICMSNSFAFGGCNVSLILGNRG